MSEGSSRQRMWNVFYCFHYPKDGDRVRRIIDVAENKGVRGQSLLPPERWRAIRATGDESIRQLIDSDMNGRACAVVLIGQDTARRRWVGYEIERAWGNGMGLVGVYIHLLTGSDGNRASRGGNPFDNYYLAGRLLSSVAKVYDPPGLSDNELTRYIAENLATWVDEAVEIRKRNGIRKLTYHIA